MKTLLITGASTGFGRSLGKEALQRGYRVALAARDPDKVSDLLDRYPETASAIRFDLTEPADAPRAVAETVERFGSLDVLVNNAGYGLLAALEETTDEQLERNLATNLVGPLRLIRAALPVMRGQGSGHIVNISAIAASANEPGFSVYGGAKAGLDAASEAIAAEVAPLGIRVTLVVPGPFRTDFIGRSLDTSPRLPDYAATVGKFATLLQRINGRQTGDPARAARAICAIIEAEKPPFRLILGAYANDKFAKKLKALEAERAAWEEVGRPTDFPPGQ